MTKTGQEKQGKSNKQTPDVEWIVTKDDAEWEHLCAPLLPDISPAANRRLLLPCALWSVAALLLLLASTGGRWWHRTQAGLHQTEADLQATAQRELQAVAQVLDPLAVSRTGDPATTDWWYQRAREVNGLRTAVQTTDPNVHLDVVLETVEIQGDQAVVRVATDVKHGAPAYRQTRFYRRTGEGWQQTAPDTTAWGPARRLETPSFVFHFRQHDALSVIPVATQVEALYATMRQNFGLPFTPGARKLAIEVSVAQTPGHAAPWFGAPDPIIVPSPAVYWAPVELTDAELLAQSIVLPLVTHVLEQARERHQVGPAWHPMVNGLHLWQLWDLDLPLAAWREDVVKWMYVGLPATRSGQPVVLPDRYVELCAEHKLWMPSPAQMNIPLVCEERDWEDWHLAPWGSHDPLTRLDQIFMPVLPDDVYRNNRRQINHPSQAVTLATLIEYAAATYRRERLPVLVAGLGQYESWDTLLPAVYGVSPAEFEAGWQAHLAAHYGSYPE